MTDLLGRLLPHDKMNDRAWVEEQAVAYQAAKPYPHICFDNFFDAEVLERVLADFPDPSTFSQKFNNERELKYASKSEDEIPPFPRAFIHALNSGPFIEFVEQVTGVRGLVADPHLVGGGFHSLPRGGKLAIHTDFNYHKQLKLDRRINALVYLNKDWPDAYGGYFEAWSPGASEPGARYLPLFNRLVMFTTTDYTFHGNPDPVMCPEDRSRRSIAMYYYTNGRPASEWTGLYQTTRFMNRPGEAIVEPDPLWRKAANVMPRAAREWFTRHVHQKRMVKR